jgi:predicted transcriptional regulator
MDTTQVAVRLPTSLVVALDALADSEQRSRANMTARLIASALQADTDTKEKN